MNVFKRTASKFTARGRALAQISQGMDCANKNDADNAIKHYSGVINSAETPRDVQAMALFNRALMYTSIGEESQATKDLKTILNMPEAMPKIKKSANQKLVRMKRKLEREKMPDLDSQPQSLKRESRNDDPSTKQ